ncbi:MAG: DUF362 domain-containing protein [Planctomycetota bacterium]
MERVTLIKCNSYEADQVLQAVQGTLQYLGGIEKFVKRSDRVILKPNILVGKPPEKHVTTHPSIVEAVAKLVIEAGAKPFIGDSPAIGNLQSAAKKGGFKEVADRLGIGLLDFERSVEIKGFDDGIFKKIEVAREALEADAIINLPKLKTHSQMLLTLGVKNMFGCVVGLRKSQWHMKAGSDRDFFATMLLELCRLLNPTLTIIDGIVGMEGFGPQSGDLVNLGLLMASANPVALDTAITALLNIDPEIYPVQRVAANKRILGSNINDIEMVGDHLSEEELPLFEIPHLSDVEFGPRFVRGHAKNLFTSKPLEIRDRCTLCGHCAEICPPKVIEVTRKELTIDYNQCIRCYCCHEICPEGAMEIKQGFFLRLAGK